MRREINPARWIRLVSKQDKKTADTPALMCSASRKHFKTPRTTKQTQIPTQVFHPSTSNMKFSIIALVVLQAAIGALAAPVELVKDVVSQVIIREENRTNVFLKTPNPALEASPDYCVYGC